MKIGHSSGWVCGGTPGGIPTDGAVRVAQLRSADISLVSPPVSRHFEKNRFPLSIEAQRDLMRAKAENQQYVGLGVRWDPGVNTDGWRVPSSSNEVPGHFPRFPTGSELF